MFKLPQREIKFRAWNNWNKRMVYWEELKKDVDLVYLFNDAINTDKNSWQVMQFTGLHDKNGKEIYEFDIVKIKSCGDEYIDVVKFYIDGDYQSCFRTGILGWHRDEIEVIGNVFENPNLLKK